MKLYEVGLGPYLRPVSTNSSEAQQFFTQGFQLLFSFTPEDAARSFREAQKRDPDCAFCYWGEALAWGPYLNGGMGRADAPRAYAAIQKAQALAADHANDVEAALIEALATRYEPAHDADRRAMLDSAYSDAMRGVYERFPGDFDVATLYAESLMLIEPPRGTWTTDVPAVRRIHSVLEGVLDQDITHPGACHLYIHATEATVAVGRAEVCADHLRTSVPGASHMNHMPSHTYNRIGRWGESVKANLRAWHADQQAAIGEGFAIYPSHNLHMLLFSASYDGQGGVAIQGARDYARLVTGGQFYVSLALLRFGRYAEVLENTVPPENNAIQTGLWDFARGYAHLRLGAVDSAGIYLAKVKASAEEGGESVSFRGHSAEDLLGIAGAILEAEMLLLDGNPDRAIRLLQEMTIVEDGLRYDEPEPLNFSIRHWLGAHLLEAGRAEEAEETYRAELAKHPTNGWSLLGLEQSLRAQGRAGAAVLVSAQFREAWARSDTWIRSSRF